MSYLRSDRLKVLERDDRSVDGGSAARCRCRRRARSVLRAEVSARPTEESLVNSWLLAHYAQQLGIVVSDDAINSFLQAETMDRVTSEEMQEVFQHAGLSAGQFFILLRQELLAMKVQELFQPSLRAATPAERWDYFNRINRYATIEAVAVPVADYVGKVANPTEEELKTFFEENKERIAMPDSPKPGFHQPQRIALQYVKADVEKFADPKTITDQQVQERYEKEKEQVSDGQLRGAREEAPPREAGRRGGEETGRSRRRRGQPRRRRRPPQPSKPPATPAKAGRAAAGIRPQRRRRQRPSGRSRRPRTSPKDAGQREEFQGNVSCPWTPPSCPLPADRVRGRERGREKEKKEEKKADAKAKPPLPAKPETPAPPPAPPAGGETPAADTESPGRRQKPRPRAKTPAGQKPGKPRRTKPQPPKTGLTDELKDRIRREIARRKSTRSSPS